MVAKIHKCMKCNNTSTRTYSTGVRGYGSKFDCCNVPPVFIHLCEECANRVRGEWFEEHPTVSLGYVENYLYEKEIINFIDELPKASRDLINNRENRKYNFYH